MKQQDLSVQCCFSEDGKSISDILAASFALYLRRVLALQKEERL